MPEQQEEAQIINERVRLYLGTGCGKTTATLGLALRALAKGKNVTIVFFDKLEENSSESKSLKLLANCNEDGFGKLAVFYKGNAEVAGGLSLVQEALVRKDDIVIADEVLDAARAGLLDWLNVKTIFALRQDPTVLVLTGRKAPDWLMDMATTISITTQLRHHGRAIEGMDC